MIEITLESLLLGYALGIGSLLLVAWLFGEWRRASRDRRDRNRHRPCRLCGSPLSMSRKSEAILECQNCGARNEARRQHSPT